MANNKDTTTTLGIDISQFKRGLQDAQRQIKLANADFKAASAGMDKWSDSAEGVKAKIKQLETTLDAENKKLELQKQRLIEVEREQGKNSAGADELRIAIANQQAAIAKTEKSLGYFNGKLSDMNKAENQAKTATGQLTDTINEQQSELDALKKKYTDVVIAQGANSKEAKALGAQITALSGDLADNKQTMAEAENAADKLDKSLTDVGDAADEAGKDAENAANGGFTVLKGVMANLATQAINAALDGLKNMGSALLNVGKQAVAGYAEMEQLKGGVQKLFEDDATAVIKYAESAYKTAGLNANDYMETVTSFSASLISGLEGDTAKAAEIADMAIRDMSDNANTFGTDIASIQNAYQGFAKGNFTMLDNLKLGYGGTQEEMARLVNESGVLGDSMEVTAETVKDVPFDQLILAINKTQERMGIMGATAAEAAGTIEGSANSMKASWANLVTGIGDSNADLEGLINNFIESLLTYANNLMPVIKTAIGGITTLIVQLVQELLPQLLQIITDELPGFLNAGAQLLVTLIQGIVTALPQLTTAVLSAVTMIITTISEAIPDIVAALVEAIPQIVTALLDAIPELLDAAVTLLTAIVDAIPLILPIFTQALPQIIDQIVMVLNNNIPVILNAAITLLNAILDAIPVVIKAIVPLLPKIVTSIVKVLKQNIPTILNAAINLLMSIVKAIPVIVNALVPEIPNIINTVVGLLAENIPVLLDAAIQFLMAIIDAIPTIIETLTPIVPNIVLAIVETLINNIPVLLKGAFEMFMAIVKAIPLLIAKLIPALGKIIQTIRKSMFEPVTRILSTIWDKLVSIFSPVAKWINENVFKPIMKFFQPVIDFFKTAFEIIAELAEGCCKIIKVVWGVVASWFKDKVITPISDTFEKIWNKVKNGAKSAWDGIKSVFSPVVNWFEDKFSKAWQKVKDVFSTGGKVFDGIKDGIVSAFKTVVNAIIRGINKVIAVPFKAINKMLDKIKNVSIMDIKPFENLISRFDVPEIPELASGGILKRGQVGLLEGNGAEAVVPLDQNKKWINKTAQDMKQALINEGVFNGKGGDVVNNYNFTQNNTSPKPLNRLEIYRQTKNQLNFAQGV